MTGSLDLVRLKTQVEAAMETLLRAADARVSWKQQQQSDHDSDAASQQESAYTFLPGVYHSLSPHSAHDGESSPASAHGSAEPSSDGDVVRVVLHGDNSFEYLWTMRRSGPRAMEFSVEMRGEWTKPVLNRSRRGTEDQRVFLCVRKMRFQRLSNYDAEIGAWKVCLKTLTRHGSDWTVVGETERGVPPINIVFSCVGSGDLESTGAVLASQVLSNSPACRVLAGLTKKVANKLGAPIDVMTNRWLPPRHLVLTRAPLSEQHGVRAFNPLICLAKALLQQQEQQEKKSSPPSPSPSQSQSQAQVAT